jgi:L-ascorbate metabolism protein UlaG (beta-lactamase superfamily)
MQLPSSTSANSAGPAAKDRLSITWLGHSTFLLRSPKGARLLLDPWLTSNPACPEKAKKVDGLDLILVTHGHVDHCGDAVSVGRATGAAVVASHELALWLGRQGLKNLRGMNIGGRQTLNGITVFMVQALHSSSAEHDGTVTYLGPATGFIVRFEDGVTIYFAGDTGLFGDMKMLGEHYAPSIAFLPIGDLYTMGPEDAALAGAWLGVKTIVPMHYGTFPALTGTLEQLRECCRPRGIDVVAPRAGETVTL